MSNIEDVSENAQTLETEGTTQEVKEVKSIDEPQDKVDDISSALTTEYDKNNDDISNITHETDSKLHFYSLNVGLRNLIIISYGKKAVLVDSGSIEESFLQINTVPFVPYRCDSAKVHSQKAEYETMLNDFFQEEGITFQVYIPFRILFDPKHPENMHKSNNLIWTVDFRGRKIFLPGDAHPDLIPCLFPL